MIEPRLPPSPTRTPTLLVNPGALNFGTVSTTTTAIQQLQVGNPSDTAVILIVASVDNSAFTFDAFPTTIAAGDTIGINVTYTAGPAGTTDTGTLTIQGHMDNSPIRIPLTGNSVSTAAYAISINPSSWFFSSVQEGTTSDPQSFIITNTGLLNITITSIVADGPFIVGNLPGLPFTLSSQQSVTITASYVPSAMGLQVQPDGFTVTSNAGVKQVQLQGVGQPFTPRFTVNGTLDVGIAAFRNTAFQFDNKDFNNEAICEAVRWHDFLRPGVSKNYLAACLVYEDLGICSLNVYAAAHGSNLGQTISIGHTASGDVMDATAELPLPSGYAIKTQIERLPNWGKVSLLGIIHKYAVEQVYRGTLQIPDNFIPAFTVGAINFEACEFAFSNTVLRCNNLDFNTEVDCVATREHVFNELGFEKSLLRAEVLYENYGEALITVQADSRRDINVRQSVRIGDDTGDFRTDTKLVDLDVEDEVITVTLSRKANDGQLWLSALVLRHVPRGEVKG